jgi:DNA-binding response OmpR family regulator/DNA-binding CsgD family transcriptional regulator
MPKTILIVDDVPANIGVLADVLHGAGHKVVVAESGESALELLGFLKPDLVLLDVQMPGVDGITLCQRLKGDEATRDTPVLFITALGDVGDKVKGFGAGAVDYIAKPFHAEEVLARVNAHLRLRELQLALEQRNDELDREVQARLAAERELAQTLDQAVVVARPDGSVAFCSDTAAALLRRFFPHFDPSRVPEPLTNGSPPPPGLRVRRGGNALIVLAEEPPPATPARLAPLGLTPRETETLFWVAQGKTNAEVGIILGAASGTVKNHVEAILLKLGVETRLAAALKAMELLGRG